MPSVPSPASAASASQFRRPHLFNLDVIIKVGSLLFSIALVWWIYDQFVIPEVQRIEAVRRYDTSQQAAGDRSLAKIIKDLEQQAEITFWIWALILLALKLWRISQENKMLAMDYLRLETGERILPDDALSYYKDLKTIVEDRPAWRERILPAVVLAALHRFHSTQSIMDAAQAAKERTEVAGNDMEAELSLVRYIAWAIPALGFIGTVRGIGEALAQAEQAIAGNLSAVIEPLGLAFNSTLTALVLSMMLMFVLHLLQGRQDKLILDLQNYCDEHVVGQMKVPAQETGTPAFQAT